MKVSKIFRELFPKWIIGLFAWNEWNDGSLELYDSVLLEKSFIKLILKNKFIFKNIY